MSQKAHYIETVEKKEIGLGEFHSEKHMLGNGKVFQFEVYHLPPFATIIPYNKNLKKFLMIKQYRPSWRRISLEFPAGVSDPKDKSLLETAKREFEEETGYKTLTIEEIGIFNHSARTTQKFGIFFTDSFTKTEMSLDEAEFIEEQLWLTEKEIEQAINNQEMIDGSHIMGWYRFLSKKSNNNGLFFL